MVHLVRSWLLEKDPTLYCTPIVRRFVEHVDSVNTLIVIRIEYYMYFSEKIIIQLIFMAFRVQTEPSVSLSK